MGANKNSIFFYNKVKGRVEEALQQLNYDSLYIIRPALIKGNRAEKRFAEKFAIKLFDVVNFLLPAKYKSVQANAIATAMLHYASNATNGNHIIASNIIKAFE